MFYSNEADVSQLITKDEIVQELEAQNIDSYFEVVELMATPRELIPSARALDFFKETYTITVQDIEVEVISSLTYQRYINVGTNKVVRSELQEEVKVPMLGLVIQRKNAKKNLDSIRLNYNMFKDNADYLEIKAAHKARVLRAKREQIAQQVLDAREANVIDLDKATEYRLHVQYDNTPAANKTQFLIDNGFSGLDNLGVYNSRPDGYGHTTGRCTNIDFASRSINVVGFSSDD